MKFTNALVSSSVIAITSSSVLAQSTAVQWTVASGGNGNWYEGDSVARTWASANTAAINRGAHLATSTSAAENAFLVLVSASTVIGGLDRPWLGGYQDTNSISYSEPAGGWRWVTDERWTFTSWSSIEPNNLGGAENWLHFGNNNGDWNDLPASSQWASLLEWSADCNNDGIVDYGQILSGVLVDTNGNNVPDCCEGGGIIPPNNLLLNGGFEQSNYPGVCCGQCGTVITIPGWVVSNVDQLINDPNFTAPEGVRWVDLNQCSAGWIRQTVSVTQNRQYRLRFLLGSLYAPCSPNPRHVTVTCGSIVEQIVLTPGSGYNQYQFTATANSNSMIVEFNSTSEGCEGGNLDAVSLQEVSCIGDLVINGIVDGEDFCVLLNSWGTNGSANSSDLNGDEIVDGFDLGVVLGAWGACPN